MLCAAALQNAAYRLKVGDGDNAVNKLRWSPDGRHMAVGDSNGVITILKVAADAVTMRSDDVDEFSKKMSALSAGLSQV